MDWIQLPVGTEHDFNGLEARWMGQVQLPKDIDLNKKGSSGYHPTTVKRTSQMGFNSGQPVFILEDPEGRTWVMQAYGLIDDPSLTYEGLMTLETKLKNIPSGWNYRVQVIDKDLVIHADNTGTAYIASRILAFMRWALISALARMPWSSSCRTISSAYSFCKSVIGMTRTCSGESHTGKLPA